MDPQMAYALRQRHNQLALRLMALEKEATGLREIQQNFGVARVEDLPGRKKPLFVPLRFEFAQGSETPETRVYNISQTGPEVYLALWAASLDGATGRFRPVSSMVDNAQNPAVVDSFDGTYEVVTSGSGWKWQTEPVSTAALFSNRDRPMYLEAPEYLEPQEAIKVTITPTRALNRLSFFFCLLGYKVFDTSRYTR